MHLIIFMCLFSLAIGDDELPFHSSGPSPRCPRNQRWLRCGPPCGDRQCPTGLDSFFVRKCESTRCGRPGCYCREGYFRNENGHCVDKSACGPRCRRNEQWDQCGNECEPQCPASFLEVGRRPWCNRQICSKPACVCKDGFYRSPSGVCVQLQDCPTVCGPNEFFNSCGNTCEETCHWFNSGQPKICPAICRPPGACQCNKGYYRNSEGQCVPPSKCSRLQCRGLNEVPDECAPPLYCQSRCGRDDFQQDNRCFQENFQCRPGCVCQDGYIRHEFNRCIPRHWCPRHHRQSDDEQNIHK